MFIAIGGHVLQEVKLNYKKRYFDQFGMELGVIYTEVNWEIVEQKRRDGRIYVVARVRKDHWWSRRIELAYYKPSDQTFYSKYCLVSLKEILRLAWAENWKRAGG